MHNSNHIVIKPGTINKNYWKDIWHFKEILYILSWRDIKVKYKQTTLGILWALLKPLITIAIFTFIFGVVAKLNQTSNTPYVIIVFSGLLPWQFFSLSLSEASNSLITNSNLISKVYFPRVLIPLSSVITTLVDFLITLLILAVILVIYKYVPSANIFALPFFILLTVITSFSFSLLFTALNVKYRDFRYIVPFIMQLGIYFSPVGFSTQQITNKIGEAYKDVLYLNPLTGIIDGFRWCIIGEKLYLRGLLISLIITLLFCCIGIRYFRNSERSFADNI